MPRKATEDVHFIQKLSDLKQKEETHYVEWASDGKGFIIVDEKMFTNQILVKKFGLGRFDSFIRKLNKLGFKRSKLGKNKIRFFHKQFVRDSKSYIQIKKLSKEQSLPRHIKLRLMLQKVSSYSEQNTDKEKNGMQSWRLDNEQDNQNGTNRIEKHMNENGVEKCEKQDIGIYLTKETDVKSQHIFMNSGL